MKGQIIPDKGASSWCPSETSTDTLRHGRNVYCFAQEANGEWFYKQIYLVRIQ